MSLKFEDYYKVLGVARDASQDDIQRAYRKLARQYHPDVNKSPEAEARFKQVGEAYEVLKDPDKRKKYDVLGENWKAGQQAPPQWEQFFGRQGGAGGGRGGAFNFRTSGGGGAFSDFFEMFFGSGGPSMEDILNAQRQGNGSSARGRAGSARQDVRDNLRITLEEAFHGGSRRLTMRRPDGSSRTIDVTVPRGATDGKTIRLKGQGVGGGDLLLKLLIAPHARFGIDGHNLTATIDVQPWQAALGAKVDVPTMAGEVNMTVPAGTSSGAKLRLKGRGLPKGNDEAGDLIAQVRVTVPKQLSDEQRALYEQLRDVEGPV